VQVLVPDLAPTPATAIDLSTGGAFLEATAALPLGLNVKVKLMPQGRPPITVSGRILRVGHTEKSVKHPELDYLMVRAAGMAVKFDPVERAALEVFEAFLETLDEL
jgi:hypothetical protein